MKDTGTGKKSRFLRACGDLAISGCLILGDQVSKYLVRAYLRPLPGGRIVLADGILELQYLENRGAAFGMLEDRGWLFCIFALAVILVTGTLCIRCPSGRRLLPFRLSMVFILAGAAGNLTDRVARGYVTDFIYFRLIHFPVFNGADICVTIGTCLLMILLVFRYRDDDLSWVKRV